MEYNVPDEDTEEEELISIPTYNLGAISVWHQLSHQELYKRIIEVFRILFNDMKENLKAMIIAREIHNYYIKHEEVTIRTVLGGIDNATRVYKDVVYGIGNNISLIEWIKPLLSKHIEAHPQYNKIKSYFRLSNKEMKKIYAPNSMLSKLIAFAKGIIV